MHTSLVTSASLTAMMGLVAPLLNMSLHTVSSTHMDAKAPTAVAHMLASPRRSIVTQWRIPPTLITSHGWCTLISL